MCDQKSTHITNYLNQFCDIEIWLKHKICIFQNLDFEMKNRFLQNSCEYKNMILKQIWSILYMDRIQYTYKMYIYIFDMKFKNRLNGKPKPINFKLLCVCELEHINTI